MMPELLLADCAHCVNLVTQNKERNLGKFLDRKQGIELSLGFGESLKVRRVGEEDDAVNFGEVIAPKSAS